MTNHSPNFTFDLEKITKKSPNMLKNKNFPADQRILKHELKDNRKYILSRIFFQSLEIHTATNHKCCDAPRAGDAVMEMCAMQTFKHISPCLSLSFALWSLISINQVGYGSVRCARA